MAQGAPTAPLCEPRRWRLRATSAAIQAQQTVHELSSIVPRPPNCGRQGAAAMVVASAPADLLVTFLLVPQLRYATLRPFLDNPLGASMPEGLSNLVIHARLGLILLAFLGSVAAAIERYRRARGDERLQLKWFAFAVGLIALARVYGVATSTAGLAQSVEVQTAFDLAFFALPLAIGIAILRYRLYDIDLIINRSLVYVSLTTILYAVYVAVTTFLQRLLISLSGQKSDAAYVLAAFVVAGAFNPVKDWLQRFVNRRLGGATAPV